MSGLHKLRDGTRISSKSRSRELAQASGTLAQQQKTRALGAAGFVGSLQALFALGGMGQLSLPSTEEALALFGQAGGRSQRGVVLGASTRQPLDRAMFTSYFGRCGLVLPRQPHGGSAASTLSLSPGLPLREAAAVSPHGGGGDVLPLAVSCVACCSVALMHGLKSSRSAETEETLTEAAFLAAGKRLQPVPGHAELLNLWRHVDQLGHGRVPKGQFAFRTSPSVVPGPGLHWPATRLQSLRQGLAKKWSSTHTARADELGVLLFDRERSGHADGKSTLQRPSTESAAASPGDWREQWSAALLMAERAPSAVDAATATIRRYAAEPPLGSEVARFDSVISRNGLSKWAMESGWASAPLSVARWLDICNAALTAPGGRDARAKRLGSLWGQACKHLDPEQEARLDAKEIFEVLWRMHGPDFKLAPSVLEGLFSIARGTGQVPARAVPAWGETPRVS
jgi:hypothetical protein